MLARKFLEGYSIIECLRLLRERPFRRESP
jgi:hypothetical protein